MPRTIEVILLGKDKLSGALKSASGGLSGFGKAALAAGAVGATALIGAGAAAAKLALDAAKLEPTKITFESLAETIGTTGDAMLKKLRPATKGIVSDAELMKAANKLMAMGLAETEDEAAKLAEMATTLGMAMGEDATASMENFALMLANQSIPRLDSFGISSGTVRERIGELMAETEGLTREQAFMQAVMEQGEKSMAKVGDISGTAAVTMGKFKATVDNLKMAVGNALLPVLKGFLDKVIIPLIPKIIELGSKIGEWLGPFMQRIAEEIGPKLKTIFEVIKTFVMDHLIPAIQKLYNWFKDNILPIFQQFAEEIGPRVKDFLEKLGQFIRDTLVPALQAFWERTEGIREAFASFMSSAAVAGIKVFLQGLVIVWDALATVLGTVWDILGSIADRLGALIDRFRGWELPSWLRMRSPSPLETGLRGISDAFRDMPMAMGGVTGMGTMTLMAGGAATITVEGLGPGITEELEERIAMKVFDLLIPGRA